MEGMLENQLVCRACLKTLEINKSSYGYIEDDHGNLREMIMCCVPEMDLYISDDPVMCFPCIQLLIVLHNFKTRCFNSETIIRSYFQKFNLTDDNQINLMNVVHDLIKTNNYSKLQEQQKQLTVQNENLGQGHIPKEISFFPPIPQTPVSSINNSYGQSMPVSFNMASHRLQPSVNPPPLHSYNNSSINSPTMHPPSPIHTPPPINSPPPLKHFFHPYQTVNRMPSPEYFPHRGPVNFSNSWSGNTGGPIYSSTAANSFNPHHRPLGTMYLNGGPLLRYHLPPVNSHNPPPLYRHMPLVRSHPPPNFHRMPINNSGHPLMLIINRTPSNVVTPTTVIPPISRNEVSSSVISEHSVDQPQNCLNTQINIPNDVPDSIINLKEKTESDVNPIESKRRLVVRLERNELIESMIKDHLSKYNSADEIEDFDKEVSEDSERSPSCNQNQNIFQCIGCMYLTTSPTFFAEHQKTCKSDLGKNKDCTEKQDQILQNPVLKNPVLASPVLASPVLASPVLASPVLASPVLANPVLENPLLENPVLGDIVSEEANPVKSITWHVCQHCNYKTTEKFCLRRHSRTLHPEFPFDGDLTCPYCNYRTTLNHHLNKHMIKHEVDNTLRCQFCSYTSKDRSNFRRHIFIHSPIMIQCEYCDYKNSSPYSIKCHLRKYHHGVGQEDVDCKSEQPLEDVVNEINTAIKSQNTQGQEME